MSFVNSKKNSEPEFSKEEKMNEQIKVSHSQSSVSAKDPLDLILEKISGLSCVRKFQFMFSLYQTIEKVDSKVENLDSKIETQKKEHKQ